MNYFIASLLVSALSAASAAQERPLIVASGTVSQDRENEFRLMPRYTNEKWIYSSTKAGNPLYSLYETQRTAAGWSAPIRFNPAPDFKAVNTLEAFFTDDGRYVFFVSDKDTTSSEDFDIWMAPTDNGKVGSPKKLPKLINSTSGEWFPSYQNGNLLFGSERPGGLGRIDLYTAKFDGTTASQLTAFPAPINSRYEDFDPVMARDGSFLIFSSNRPSQYEGNRLFIVFRETNGTWSTLISLGKELAPHTDGSAASLSADQKTLYFTARATSPRRSGDLYSIDFQPILTKLRAEPKNSRND
ncbi:MAG: hypothetical protein COB37_08685 [Kordiimonadales bacterium]|nr:MAG: hypothetical protein COB37_08685 [Kordiimonadales bacterium]